jgi:hypothetical protein
MLYHVYKLQMSDAARNALNSAGSWDAHPESKVYAELRHSLRSSDALPHSVMSAALMGMYHHGLTVQADNLEQVFAYDNGAPLWEVARCHTDLSLPWPAIAVGRRCRRLRDWRVRLRINGLGGTAQGSRAWLRGDGKADRLPAPQRTTQRSLMLWMRPCGGVSTAPCREQLTARWRTPDVKVHYRRYHDQRDQRR